MFVSVSTIATALAISFMLGMLTTFIFVTNALARMRANRNHS